MTATEITRQASPSRAPLAAFASSHAAAPRLSAISTYTAGAEIYAPGETAGSLYRIDYGAVRVHRLLSDGRRQVIGFYLAGEIFGFEADRTHSFFAEAVVETGLRLSALDTSPAGAQQTLKMALQAMARAQDHLTVVGRQTAIERIAGFLVDIARRQGNPGNFDLPMSRLDIADYLGLTIETVSRVFAKLRTAGMINLLSVRSVSIPDMDALAGLAA